MAVRLLVLGLVLVALLAAAAWWLADPLVALTVLWLPWPVLGARSAHARGRRRALGLGLGVLGPLGALLLLLVPRDEDALFWRRLQSRDRFWG